jgi:hypothetical protein
MICNPDTILFGVKPEDEMGRACSAYEKIRGIYRVLEGKHEGTRLLG